MSTIAAIAALIGGGIMQHKSKNLQYLALVLVVLLGIGLTTIVAQDTPQWNDGLPEGLGEIINGLAPAPDALPTFVQTNTYTTLPDDMVMTKGVSAGTVKDFDSKVLGFDGNGSASVIIITQGGLLLTQETDTGFTTALENVSLGNQLEKGHFNIFVYGAGDKTCTATIWSDGPAVQFKGFVVDYGDNGTVIHRADDTCQATLNSMYYVGDMKGTYLSLVDYFYPVAPPTPEATPEATEFPG